MYRFLLDVYTDSWDSTPLIETNRSTGVDLLILIYISVLRNFHFFQSSFLPIFPLNWWFSTSFSTLQRPNLLSFTGIWFFIITGDLRNFPFLYLIKDLLGLSLCRDGCSLCREGIKVNGYQLVPRFYLLMSCHSISLSFWWKCIESIII